MEMNKEEVMRNLREVCRQYKGSLTDHQYLQAALKWVEEKIPEPEVPNLEGEETT